VNVPLMASLLDALPETRAALLLVGDVWDHVCPPWGPPRSATPI